MTSTHPVDPRDAGRRSHRLTRLIERLSWSIGIAAIALWAAASVAGAIGARREVGRFAALQAAAIADAAAPDQSLWSPERVKAWRETQTRTAPAPLGRKITRDGQPLQFSSLREGDRLTATIVTSAPPKVMTQRQVEAAMKSVPAAAAAAGPAPAPAAGAPAPAGAATTGTEAAPARRLPKTGSALPALGLLGAALVTLGAALTARRRLASGVRRG